MDLSLEIILVLFLIGIFAGFVDSIAGGAGIIVVPSLLAVGMPPHMVFGTAKLQSIFGLVASIYSYHKNGLFSFKGTLQGIIFTLIGSLIGGYLVHLVPADFLKKLIPILLFIIFLFMLINKKFGKTDRKARISERNFYIFLALTLGFYDGFFGPGAGTFWMIALVGLLGLNLKKATAQTKIMNLSSNLGSLLVFAYHINVAILVSIVMGIGQFLGSYIGANIVHKKEINFIRNFLLIVIALTISKSIYDTYFLN